MTYLSLYFDKNFRLSLFLFVQFWDKDLGRYFCDILTVSPNDVA